MAELLTVALAANAQVQFRKAGSYIEIIDSTYSVGINLYSDLGGQTDSLIGALSGFFLGSQFGAFDIKNGAIAQTVQLLVLDPGEIGGSRRQPGTVRVIDQSIDKTNGGKQFLGGNTQPATVSSWPALGMVANAKTAACRKIYIASPTAGDVYIGTVSSAGTGMGTQSTFQNKLLSGGASISKITAGFCASNAPTNAEIPGWSPFFRISVSANLPTILDFSAVPFVMSGSQGIVVLDALTGNRQLSAFFEIEEI